MRALIAAILFELVTLAQVAPEVLRLSQAQRQINLELSRLPDYTCLETILRRTRPSARKPFKKLDTVQLEVALVGGRELYAWPGSREFQAQSPSALLGLGMAADGDFAVHVRNIFTAQAASMHYQGEEPSAWRYDYRLSSVLGGYTVTYHEQQASTSAHGSFWIDKATLRLRRFTSIEDDLPLTFPVASVETTVEFANVQIGGQQVLLPQSSHVVMTERSGAESVNHTEFTHCRQYRSEALISFNELPDAPGTVAPQKSVPEVPLPAGLRIPVAMLADLNLETAQIGDPIAAILTADVRAQGAVLVPKNAHLAGRLRRLEAHASPEPYWVVGIEFDELRWPAGRARFVGQLLEIDLLTGARFSLNGSSTIRERQLFGDRVYTTTQETIFTRDLPGVGTFFLLGPAAKLPRGFRMTWQIRSLSR